MRKPDSINPILLYYLGRRVRARREAIEPNQERFAAEHGYDRNLWGRIERGLQNVSASSLLRVCAALGVTMADLLAGIEDEVGRDPDRERRLTARRGTGRAAADRPTEAATEHGG